MDPHTSKRLRLDVSGDCLYDEENGEFLGAFVWCRDVAEYTNVIAPLYVFYGPI